MIKEKIQEGIFMPLIFDRMFKVVFNLNNKVLIKMLNDIMGLDINEESKVIVSNSLIPYEESGRFFEQDLVIELDSESFICIEMNKDKNSYSFNRNFMYGMMYIRQKIDKNTSKKSIDDYNLKLLNLNMFPNECNELVEEAAFFYIKSGRIATKIFKIYDFNIDNNEEILYNGDEKKNRLIRWSKILRTTSYEDLIYWIGDDLLTMEEKEEFLRCIKMANRNGDLYREWISKLNNEMKYEMTLENAKKEALLMGEKQGIEEGEEKGFKKGIKQGVKKGKMEGAEEKVLEVIINMLKKKLDYDTISEVTGKTIEEIKEIEKNI